MTSEQWRRVKELLHETLELPPAQRRKYLDTQCGTDPELRREVESLVASHDEAGEEFMDAPPAADQPRPKTAAAARHGERIGSYQILREIGRGGMGSVYLATRADDMYRKQVAIKVLRRGLDSEIVTRRFRNERQILASLEHPNIASLLDGGTTDDGLPYFVMEYIDGEPIDAYCDRHRLSTTERLGLFCKVCTAVDFAHRRRIIHRDIKPGNILIGSNAEPKLLDFGIAKILDPELSGETIDPTMTQLRMMTPEYASPEQIRGSTVTAAADIYSLGVLLYELLTGHRPYRVKSRTPHEIAHAICEETPDRPSTAIQRVDEVTRPGGDPLTVTPQTVSEARRTEPSELRKSLAGDLDNIVLMAMRKEPERRYASAGEFAGDISRHLEGRPVRARGDTFVYRTGKLVHRNRGLILTAFIAACAGVLAMVVMNNRGNPRMNPFTQARTVPFTTLAGDEVQPVFSPDGRRVAFVWKGEQNDRGDIYIKNLDGVAAPVRLTGAAAEDSSPAWSPDGREIAFLRLGKDSAGFYVVPSNGGAERKIASASPLRFERLGRQVEWSRDGRKLLVVDRESPNQPYAISELPVDGGERRPITRPAANSVGDVALALSPAGDEIAVLHVPGSGVSELVVQPLDGGAARPLTNDNRWIMAVTWSPDGRDLVFSSNRHGAPALWQVPARGGTPERLEGVGWNVSDPSFSRDGRHLVYSQFTIDANVWALDLKTRTLHDIVVSTQYDSSPQYSPDGKWLVFRSSRSGTNEIWCSDVFGHGAVQLTSFRGPLTGTPRWSPDSNWIAFDSRPEGKAQILAIPRVGGTPRPITESNTENVVPSFSRDGKWVYFASNRTGTWQVWRKPFDGGDAVQVTRDGGFAAFESPDGKYVYYAKGRNLPGLWRVPVAGGAETEVLADLKPGYWGYWQPTRRGIYFVDQASAVARAVIYLLDPDTGRRQTVSEIAKPLTLGTSAFAVSPDLRFIAFAQQDQSSSDILLAEASDQ